MYIVFLVCSSPVLFGSLQTHEVTSKDTPINETNSISNQEDFINVLSDNKSTTPSYTSTFKNTNIFDIPQSTEFTTTVAYETEKSEPKEIAGTEFKQAVAVTPADDVTEEEPASNVICERCTGANQTVDCHNRQLTTSFEITDRAGTPKDTTNNETDSNSIETDVVSDNRGAPSSYTSTFKNTNILEIPQSTEFTTTVAYVTKKLEEEETVVTEFKQAVAVTPADDVTEKEPALNVICERCTCANQTVDCHNRQLTRSFETNDWEDLETFQPITIDLSSNPLTNFNRISNLPMVRYLNLSNCGLVDIEYASFSYLQELVSLDLSNNHLLTSSINRRVFEGVINPKIDRIVQFTNIEYLSLANNEINSLTQDVFVFMNGLTSLNLSGNPLGDMDKLTMGAITDLVNLKELNLSGCELKTLPDGFLRRLHQLERLDLSKNRFTAVPSVVGEAANLKYLDFGGNFIETLNQSTAISNLSKLVELRLCGLSKLTKIADGALGGLESLESLHLCFNSRLTILEDGFLVWKDQFDNELWPKLKEFYLNNNNLSTIYSAYLNGWDRLTMMDFSHNPYLCDCRNQWIINVLVPMNKSLKHKEFYSNMVCTSPEDLKGMSFTELYNASKTLPCQELESLKEVAGTNMALILGVMIGIFATFPLVLVIVLLWRNGYFARCRKEMDSSSEDEESDAF